MKTNETKRTPHLAGVQKRIISECHWGGDFAGATSVREAGFAPCGVKSVGPSLRSVASDERPPTSVEIDREIS